VLRWLTISNKRTSICPVAVAPAAADLAGTSPICPPRHPPTGRSLPWPLVPASKAGLGPHPPPATPPRDAACSACAAHGGVQPARTGAPGGGRVHPRDLAQLALRAGDRAQHAGRRRRGGHPGPHPGHVPRDRRPGLGVLCGWRGGARHEHLAPHRLCAVRWPGIWRSQRDRRRVRLAPAHGERPRHRADRLPGRTARYLHG
jgi:hypothetical protein